MPFVQVTFVQVKHGHEDTLSTMVEPALRPLVHCLAASLILSYYKCLKWPVTQAPMLLAAGVDMVISTYITNNQTNPEMCGSGLLAAASPWMYERGTNRPVNGLIIFCVLIDQLDIDLAVLAHEAFHAIVRSQLS
jgi:uncharacterized membrane protein